MIVLLAVLLAAPDPAAAYRQLRAGGRVATVVQALTNAGMPRSATVLLAALAADPAQPDEIRADAQAALAARAAQEPALGQLLLDQEGDPGKLPPELALALARGSLEKALQLAPPEEGAAFTGIEQGPELTPASAQPLDPELAATMGQAVAEPKPPPAPAQSAAPGKAALVELDRARALAASVPADSPLAVDARYVSGLAALAAGDDDGAAKEFIAAAQGPRAPGDAAAAQRRDQALLQLARLAYQSGDDARATALYAAVSSSAPEWLEALFEASWSRFRRGEDEQALGNLLTLHAPFFEGRFFPESFVLKALVLYQNCRYADARAALLEFEQRYRPLHDGLAEVLARLSTPQAAAQVLARGPVALQQAAPAAALEEVTRVAQAADVLGAVVAARELAEEIDSIDRRPEPFRDSALIAVVAPRARAARIALLDSAGRKLLARLSRERVELRELLAQSLRLGYEIAGREKELLGAPDEGLSATAQRREPPQVADDEELWPFQGEYWRDELGAYRYQLGRRCKKARAPLPTAAQPAAVPEKSSALLR